MVFIQHADADEFVPGTEGWKLHPDLEQAPGDRHVGKTACDAFYATELDRLLRGLGVDTLVLMGYATEFCFDSTLRNGASHGYRIIVIADGHTTKDRPILRAEQIKAHHNWVWENFISKDGVGLLNAADASFA